MNYCDAKKITGRAVRPLNRCGMPRTGVIMTLLISMALLWCCGCDSCSNHSDDQNIRDSEWRKLSSLSREDTNPVVSVDKKCKSVGLGDLGQNLDRERAAAWFRDNRDLLTKIGSLEKVEFFLPQQSSIVKTDSCDKIVGDIIKLYPEDIAGIRGLISGRKTIGGFVIAVWGDPEMITKWRKVMTKIGARGIR